jgi:hypothetical protein
MCTILYGRHHAYLYVPSAYSHRHVGVILPSGAACKSFWLFPLKICILQSKFHGEEAKNTYYDLLDRDTL